MIGERELSLAGSVDSFAAMVHLETVNAITVAFASLQPRATNSEVPFDTVVLLGVTHVKACVMVNIRLKQSYEFVNSFISSDIKTATLTTERTRLAFDEHDEIVITNAGLCVAISTRQVVYNADCFDVIYRIPAPDIQPTDTSAQLLDLRLCGLLHKVSVAVSVSGNLFQVDATKFSAVMRAIDSVDFSGTFKFSTVEAKVYDVARSLTLTASTDCCQLSMDANESITADLQAGILHVKMYETFANHARLLAGSSEKSDLSVSLGIVFYFQGVCS